MSLVRNFSKVITQAKKEYKKKKFSPVSIDKELSCDGNILAFGDNLDFMKYLIKKEDLAGKIQQIYIDPPFFSTRKNEAAPGGAAFCRDKAEACHCAYSLRLLAAERTIRPKGE